MACPIIQFPWPAINLTERYPGHRILDKNAPEYQMEAFIYTCTILSFYTVATCAFMVKFILQAKEPWEGASDIDHPEGSNVLPMIAKLREQERHKKFVEREARRDVKMRMINHLRQISSSNLTNRKDSTQSKLTNDSDQTRMTRLPFERNEIERRASISGANLKKHDRFSKLKFPIWHQEKPTELTLSDDNSTPEHVDLIQYQSLWRPRSSPRFNNRYYLDMSNDTLVSL